MPHKIETRNPRGMVNGYLVTIWNSTDGPKVDQIYLTVIAPGMSKGPHLHKRRQGFFKVIKGSVLLITRVGGRTYRQVTMGVTTEPVLVPPGVPACLYNKGLGEAFVLNMPSPVWRSDDQDEWEVENWDPRFEL